MGTSTLMLLMVTVPLRIFSTLVWRCVLQREPFWFLPGATLAATRVQDGAARWVQQSVGSKRAQRLMLDCNDLPLLQEMQCCFTQACFMALMDLASALARDELLGQTCCSLDVSARICHF